MPVLSPRALLSSNEAAVLVHIAHCAEANVLIKIKIKLSNLRFIMQSSVKFGTTQNRK
jgi:hypothetical protein